jgi:DNA-binding response OmpR family regulator
MNKILVVDDDLEILTVVQIMLTMNNFNVEAISNWEEISNKMSEFKPDLVLLDVSLGGADGREICKSMRLSNETKNVPVILFSANPEMGKYLDQCLAQDFIPKPFELSNLVNTIKHHVN